MQAVIESLAEVSLLERGVEGEDGFGCGWHGDSSGVGAAVLGPAA